MGCFKGMWEDLGTKKPWRVGDAGRGVVAGAQKGVERGRQREGRGGAALHCALRAGPGRPCECPGLCSVRLGSSQRVVGHSVKHEFALKNNNFMTL